MLLRHFLRAGFGAILIPCLRWSTRRWGEAGWSVWERLAVAVAGTTGRLWRCAGSQEIVPALAGLIDQADAVIGARGEWVEWAPHRAVKHVRECPYAHRLEEVSDFCTRLGAVAGRAAFRAYAPGARIGYAIPHAQSRGDAYCEYVLRVAAAEFKPAGQAAWDSPG